MNQRRVTPVTMSSNPMIETDPPLPPDYPLSTEHILTKTPFFSIEYPGYIGRNEISISRALEHLGGLDRVEASFRSSLSLGVSNPHWNRGRNRERDGVFKSNQDASNTGASTSANAQRQQEGKTQGQTQTVIPLEFHFRPGNHFAHPVHADLVNMSGLVLKVTTRRRRTKQKRDEEMDIDSPPPPPPSFPSSSSSPAAQDIVPEYTTQVIGAIQKTARFRSKIVI